MNLRALAVISALALAPLALPPQIMAASEAIAVADLAGHRLAPTITHHEIDLGDERLAFDARVEMLELTDDAGERTAHLFTVAYVAPEAGWERPVTFLMNGGPGAASAYLHVGGVGPWTLRTDARGRPNGEADLAVNPHTWLAFTDLVFVDPVGTGFSRPADPEDRRFYDRRGDLESLTRAIDLWLDVNDRRTSPIYLAGESYGGYRAAALPKQLMHERGVRLNGTILVSPVIDFSTIRHHAARPMSWALLLPSYTATAVGHGRAEAVTAEELRAFALEDYLLALIHPERMAALLPRLALLTGLQEDLLRERRGRISPSEFRHRLLADEDHIVSAYDGLIAVPNPDGPGGGTRVDPVLDGMTPAFVTGFLSHLRDRLDWPHGRDYRLLSRQVNRAWTYGSQRAQGYVTAMRELQEVMALDENFRVFAAHGEADLVTPWLATDWLLDQLDDALGGVPDRLIFARYPGGHMFYMRPDASAALRADMADFFAGG